LTPRLRKKQGKFRRKIPIAEKEIDKLKGDKNYVPTKKGGGIFILPKFSHCRQKSGDRRKIH
jgi:hypothetical protein